MNRIILITIMTMAFLANNSFAKRPPSNNLLPSENRIIKIYQDNVSSVVNVANIKVARNFFYGKVEIPQGAGTGFVWDNHGHIVTNYHVVQGGDNFVVTFHNDKKQYTAKVVGAAPNKDLAVIKLEKPPAKLKPVTIGDSNILQVGQLALALGNPFGFEQSLSKGIISALDRKMEGIGGVEISGMIQTDAAINRGNSGGPLLNSSGEVVGVNTMIISPSATSAGLGFAVPSDVVKRIIPQLIVHGKVIRPGIGIGILPDHVKDRFTNIGIVITTVMENSAAQKAGLQGMKKDRYGSIYVGDIITKVNGKEVNSRNDVFQILEGFQIGDKITIEYLRGKKTKRAELLLKEL